MRVWGYILLQSSKSYMATRLIVITSRGLNRKWKPVSCRGPTLLFYADCCKLCLFPLQSTVGVWALDGVQDLEFRVLA